MLPPEELVLTPSEVFDGVERAGLRVGSLRRALRGLVVGLLLAPQLLVEQRRDVEVAVGVARPGRRGVERHLSMPDLHLRLQQLVERLHLGRKRLARLQGLEGHDGAVHGSHRRRHGIFLGRHLAGG